MIPRFDPLTLGGVTLLGAWVGADSVAFLQIMISQPLVAAWLGGWVAGEPLAGLAIGILLQGLWARGLPVGGITLPWTGPAGLVGGYLAARAPGGVSLGGVLEVPSAPVLVAIVATAWITAEAGRILIASLHRGRRGLVDRAVASAAAGDAGGVVRANLAGVGQVAALGAGLTLLGVVVGRFLVEGAERLPAADGRWPALVLLGYGIGQGLSTAGPPRRVLLAVTVLSGICVALWVWR